MMSRARADFSPDAGKGFEAKRGWLRYLPIYKEYEMKMLKFAAAVALMAGSLGIASTASAQRHDDRRGRIEQMDRRGDVRRGHVRRGDRRYQRPHHRDVRRRSYGRNCKMIWRNHRRVRVCR